MMSTSEEKYQRINKVMKTFCGHGVHHKKGATFHFPVYRGDKTRETSIESLDLSVRSYNGLKRGGYDTVDDLVGAMTEGKSLRTLRNCGAKSVAEIMEHLFLWQLMEIKPERRIKYLEKVVEMNIGA